MLRSIGILSLLLFFTIGTFSQNAATEEPSFFDNVRFGGGINIGFGNSYSTFSISPSAIYDFSPEFSAGLSATYVYVKNNSTIQSTSNILGGSALMLYRPIQYLQLSSEFEQLKITQKYASSYNASLWQPALYFGVEYVTGNLAMGLRYDVLFDENKNVIYSSALTPIFRVYF